MEKYIWIYTGKGKESIRYKLIDVDIATSNVTCENITTKKIEIFKRSQINLFATINPALKFD